MRINKNFFFRVLQEDNESKKYRFLCFLVFDGSPAYKHNKYHIKSFPVQVDFDFFLIVNKRIGIRDRMHMCSCLIARFVLVSRRQLGFSILFVCGNLGGGMSRNQLWCVGWDLIV